MVSYLNTFASGSISKREISPEDGHGKYPGIQLPRTKHKATSKPTTSLRKYNNLLAALSTWSRSKKDDLVECFNKYKEQPKQLRAHAKSKWDRCSGNRYLYSPKVQNVRCCVNHWKARLATAKARHDPPNRIIDFAVSVNMDNAMSNDQDYLDEHLQGAGAKL